MKNRLSIGLALACLPSFALAARAAPQGGGFDFGATIVGAADSNRDGDVSSDEWQAFTTGLAQDGRLDRDRIEARVVAASLDRDRDGRASGAELADALTALDTDGDGVLQASELSARGGRRGIGLGVVLQAIDADEDGALSAHEREQALAQAGTDPTAPIAEDTLVAWVTRVKAQGGEDRTAFTPRVVLLSIEGALDADGDGAATPADLTALFAGLDADGNGVVEAGELRPRRAGGQGGGGQGGAPMESFQVADAAQRAKPPLVKWQRSLEDALELQKRTGKPLLICVNMDGEAASESCAWFRYRDPEFARLTDGFVCLIVSPDRHTPIDHDDRGRRMQDPRFGRVVESEHIDIEPVLYERYFDGTRVAPRHLGIAADGTRLFDIYLTNELTRIDRALEEHGKPEASDEPPAQGQRGRGRQGRLDDPDAGARDALDQRFVEGDWRQRFELASSALLTGRTTRHPELVRMALRDPDPRVVRQALWTIVREPDLLPQELVGEAFRASAGEPVLRAALTGAFGRLALLTEDDAVRVRAQRRFLAFEGLAQGSRVVALERWRTALASSEGFAPASLTAEDLDPLTEELAALEGEIAASPDDPTLRVRQAEGLMRLARVLLAMGQDPSVALEEAQTAALAAEGAGDESGRAAGVRCWTSFFQGDVEGAATHGARALPGLVERADSPLALEVLHAFAQARTRQVYEAIGAGSDFEPTWVADVRDAYEALLVHPGGNEAQALELLGFLDTLDARAEQDATALRAVERFPISGDLHNWLRGVVLRDRGAVALEEVYAALPVPAEGEAVFRWYRGLASLVAAERQVGNREPEAALAAYRRCIELMRASMAAEPTYADSALHYVCLACAGQARLQAEAGRWDEAVALLREGLEGRTQSATTADGLGHTPIDTAQLVLSGLSAAGLDEQASTLREALGAAGVDLRTRRQGE